jgi:hypothetical protein
VCLIWLGNGGRRCCKQSFIIYSRDWLHGVCGFRGPRRSEDIEKPGTVDVLLSQPVSGPPTLSMKAHTCENGYMRYNKLYYRVSVIENM